MDSTHKRELIARIVGKLRGELALYAKAALAARAEATDEQSRAENKYDTRGLEASYLARGQSRQAAELNAAIQELEALAPKVFAPDEPVQTGALLTLETKKERLRYFLLPRGGGAEIPDESGEILVITPQSPVGQAVAGKRRGDVLDLSFGGARQRYRLVDVV